MFGALAVFLKGKIFCGVAVDQTMARIGKTNWWAPFERSHVAEMAFAGRSSKGYVYASLAIRMPENCQRELGGKKFR